MLLNVTVKYAPSAEESFYNVSATFPSYYQMGPQPFMRPIGNVNCRSSSNSWSKTYVCISTDANEFFAVFNMITPAGVNPRDGLQLQLNDNGQTVVCSLAAWCADISVGSTAKNEAGYVDVPGKQPPWVVTVIVVVCGVLVGGGLFVYAKHKLRGRSSAESRRNSYQSPTQTAPPDSLIHKVKKAENVRNAGPIASKEMADVNKPPTLLDQLAEKKKQEAQMLSVPQYASLSPVSTVVAGSTSSTKLEGDASGKVSSPPPVDRSQSVDVHEVTRASIGQKEAVRSSRPKTNDQRERVKADDSQPGRGVRAKTKSAQSNPSLPQERQSEPPLPNDQEDDDTPLSHFTQSSMNIDAERGRQTTGSRRSEAGRASTGTSRSPTRNAEERKSTTDGGGRGDGRPNGPETSRRRSRSTSRNRE
ncbi:hypothetical protein HDU76_012532 [Blyttiomyces sp. JEL0837]|nr:hypothetical protein HDU76_012532 [Blyttiomyces sp. JEL0837]